MYLLKTTKPTKTWEGLLPIFNDSIACKHHFNFAFSSGRARQYGELVCQIIPNTKPTFH